MKIMIDNQKVIEVTEVHLEDEDGDEAIVLRFDDAHRLLGTWQSLDTARRGYRYGGAEDDGEPDIIIIAWSNDQGLTMSDVDPFYGRQPGGFTDTFNAYLLDELAGALPDGMLDWSDQS